MAKATKAPSGGFAASVASAAAVIPATTVGASPWTYRNGENVSQTVVITGGTLTSVAINGVSAGTGGTYTLLPYQQLVASYTGSPSAAITTAVITTLSLNSDGSHGQRTGHGG